MDKESLTQLELQSKYFYPFSPLKFWKHLLQAAEKCIKRSFEKLRNGATDFSSDTEKSPEEINDFINIIEKKYLDSCATVMTKILNMMDELTYIPNNLDLFSAQTTVNHQDLIAENDELRKELIEQKIVIALLKQELEEYKQIESILNHTEQFIETIKLFPQFEIPENVKESLVAVTSEIPNFKYCLTKILNRSKN